MSFRGKHREKVVTNTWQTPDTPAKKKPPAHIDPTDVQFASLQQEIVFANWSARMTPPKPVGIAQRFLLSFGGDADPAPMSLATLMDNVIPPILKGLFTLIVRRIGPVLAGASVTLIYLAARNKMKLLESLTTV